jgi:hypothetical protein
MTRNPSDSSAGFSRTRRTLIGFGGVGLITGVAGYLGLKNFGSPAAQTVSERQKTTRTSTNEEPISPTAETVLEISAQGFEAYLNTEFVVVPNDGVSGEVPCRLIEVSKETRMETFKGAFRSFSLVFEAAPDFLREGGICKLRHNELSEMELFLSPIGDAKSKNRLEAAFTLRA